MSTRISISVDGLRALFPEGSEARIALANGVMENFARHNRSFIDTTLLKAHEAAVKAEVTRLVDTATADAMKLVLKQLGIEEVKSTYYSSRPTYKLPPEALEALIGQARRTLMDRAEEIATEQFTKLKAHMEPIEARLTRFLDQTEKRIVEAEARVSAALSDAAIVDRIAQLYLGSKTAELEADLATIRAALLKVA